MHGIDDVPPYWIQRVHTAMRTRTVARFREIGWDGTPEQWVVLARLMEADGRTPGQLADATFRDKAGATRIVTALEQRGLVARRPDPSDARSKQVWLTDAGRALHARLWPEVQALRAELMDGIDEETRAQVVDALRRMHANLDAVAPTG